MTSIKKNFFFSSILSTANYLFPFLTFPYISRVLGVENNGQCNFVDSIINYFILFAMMGIAILGIREIAASKNDKVKLDKTFSELILLNITATLIALCGLVAAIIFVPKLSTYKDLLYIGIIKLIFNTFLIEWLYKGLEKFKYITIRTIAVKSCYVISVFIFIKEAEDVTLYYFLTTMMIVINASINCIHARKYINLNLRDISIRHYINPFLLLGVYLLLTSMYTSLNVTVLGFITNDIQVGYYSTSMKLFNIILAIFSAFTGVMLPRMSALISTNKMDDFKSLLYKSLDLLLCISIPSMIFTFIMADSIVMIISGPGYEGATLPLQIISPLLFIIGYEQILVMQTMMPMKKDSVIFRNSMVGALASITLNILLVPHFKSIGSAICWLTSETIILILSQRYLTKVIEIHFPVKPFFKIFLYHIFLLPILLIVKHCLNENIWSQFVLSCTITLAYTVIVQVFFIKNATIMSQINRIPIVNKR